MKIAVDAMGGDYAPQAVVDGAVQAAREYGVEIILVGDSLGMLVQGGESTLSVSLEDSVYHTRCVARGVLLAGQRLQVLQFLEMPHRSIHSFNGCHCSRSRSTMARFRCT